MSKLPDSVIWAEVEHAAKLLDAAIQCQRLELVHRNAKRLAELTKPAAEAATPKRARMVDVILRGGGHFKVSEDVLKESQYGSEF